MSFFSKKYYLQPEVKGALLNAFIISLLGTLISVFYVNHHFSQEIGMIVILGLSVIIGAFFSIIIDPANKDKELEYSWFLTFIFSFLFLALILGQEKAFWGLAIGTGVMMGSGIGLAVRSLYLLFK